MKGYFKDKEPKEFKTRVFFSTVLVAVVFFLLAVRFWQLQVLDGSYYKDLSENNRIRSVKSPAPRGIIYDRSGIKIAENRPGFDLYLVPEDVTDWVKTKVMLKDLVDIDSAAVDEKLEKSKGRPPFRAVKLKEDLTWEETVKVESFKFETPGIILDVTPKRHYLYGEAAAHLIGYLGEINEGELQRLGERGYDPGDLLGKYGLERFFEGHIKGIDGTKELEVDALGRKIKVVEFSPPFPGNDVTLTIDLRTQITAWNAMREKVGAVVAIEVDTGRVLAMVSAPAFDPNKLSSGVSAEEWERIIKDPYHILTNKVIQGQYPPASTFKPIHAVAALEEKAISPHAMVFSGPAFRFAGRDYRDWKEKGHGNINIHRAIIESSDTFFYQLGLKVGVDTLARYSRKFGFGEPTGVSLAGEKSGLVPTSEWKKRAYGERWYEGETISVAVGQGFMLTTPLQLAAAYAAIANGGTLYRPTIVEEIRTPMGGVVKKFVPEKTSTLDVSPETIDRVQKALRGVVMDNGGTAHFLERSGLRIAGKTGTAQVAKLTKRVKDVRTVAYMRRDHAWFVGYAPFEDPRIAVAVLVEHGGFGSSAAAPVALEVFKAYLAEDESGKGPVELERTAPVAVKAGFTQGALDDR
ncbi:MAG TPA: penicillin-binding protein 2 [Thermodesulfobacteriota bacterium]|nr:penicillin-binding protein 2 [Thermodesulfobacteriota bacterium]